MNEQEEALKKMQAAAFVRNNGRIMRILNIMPHKFESLEDVRYADQSMDEGQFIESVNYLAESGYIHLREIQSKVEANLADTDYKVIEAKLTAAGTRLLRGKLTDELVDA